MAAYRRGTRRSQGSTEAGPVRGAEEGFGMERAASTRWESPRHLFAILLTLAALLAISALGLSVPQEARAAIASEKLSELRVRPAGSMDGYSPAAEGVVEGRSPGAPLPA